jgi:hypothetical protein
MNGSIFVLFVSLVMLSISGDGVVWQYEDNISSVSSQTEPSSPSSLPAASPVASASDVRNTSSSATSSPVYSGLWGWGGAPRGFSVENGTLKYPDDYYTSHFSLGYNNSKPTYGQTNLANLSRYSSGFTTGYNPGYNIYSLLADGPSSYDPWNNYPGYDPNYPYGYIGYSS